MKHDNASIALWICLSILPLGGAGCSSTRPVGNSTLIAARVDITDVHVPTVPLQPFGPGHQGLVHVEVWFADAFGRGRGRKFIEFNKDVEIYCDVDLSTTRLMFSSSKGHYEGDVPRARAFTGPNYYIVRVRERGVEYQVARVPAVNQLVISAPRAGSSPSIGEEVTVTFDCSSWFVLHDRADPHYMFQHVNRYALTQQYAEASSGYKMVQTRSVAGVPGTDSAVSLSVPTSATGPSALTPDLPGTVAVLTVYTSTYMTIGSSDFLLREWTSSSGSEVPVTWR